MVKKNLKVKMSVLAALAALSLAACTSSTTQTTAESTTAETTTAAETTKAAEESTKTETSGEAAAVGGGFEEFPIGDEQEVGPLVVAGVSFQPVDMEPAGNSLAKAEADAHIEADITASQEGSTLGYGKGDFVPWLKVKAFIQKEGSDNVQEISFMPMNASDGPHYGANVKFEDGVGKYKVKFEVSAPGNEYLLHTDPETGVTGRFWTEPIVVEWDDFEWNGPQW